MKNEMGLDAALVEDAGRMLPETVRLCRQLHRRPETGLDLPQTQAAVCAALDGLGLEIFLGKQLSSVVAVLDGAQPGGTVLLRADMDALRLREATGGSNSLPRSTARCTPAAMIFMLPCWSARRVCSRQNERASPAE